MVNRWLATIVLFLQIGFAHAAVDLNTATQDVLEELHGIGPVRALAIIEYRQQNGPFQTLDQLLEVKGIGPSTLERIRPQVIIGRGALRPVHQSGGSGTGHPLTFSDTPPP